MPSAVDRNFIKRCPIFKIFGKSIPEVCRFKWCLHLPSHLTCVSALPGETKSANFFWVFSRHSSTNACEANNDKRTCRKNHHSARRTTWLFALSETTEGTSLITVIMHTGSTSNISRRWHHLQRRLEWHSVERTPPPRQLMSQKCYY